MLQGFLAPGWFCYASVSISALLPDNNLSHCVPLGAGSHAKSLLIPQVEGRTILWSGVQIPADRGLGMTRVMHYVSSHALPSTRHRVVGHSEQWTGICTQG